MLPAPRSPLPAPCSPLPAPCSPLPAPCSPLPALRVAVIGAGRLGGFHAQKLAGMANVELVGVVDPLPANRDRLAAQLRTGSYSSHLALLGRIDAAVIASPTVLHHRLAVDLLEARTHLLIEKPICATVAEADELVELARQRQVVLQVGHVERFNPAFAAAVPHVRNPRFIEAARASGFTFRSMDVGVVLDLMIHDIDLVLSLARSPLRSVDALGVAILGGHEDVAHARLEFQSGCVANLSASRVSYEPARKMQIWAPRAYANIDFGTRMTTLVRPAKRCCAGTSTPIGSHPRRWNITKRIWPKSTCRESSRRMTPSTPWPSNSRTLSTAFFPPGNRG